MSSSWVSKSMVAARLEETVHVRSRVRKHTRCFDKLFDRGKLLTGKRQSEHNASRLYSNRHNVCKFDVQKRDSVEEFPCYNIIAQF